MIGARLSNTAIYELIYIFNNVTSRSVQFFFHTAVRIFFFMFMVLCIAILYYNNPTRCSYAQSILFHCSVTLHVSLAFHTHHQEYIFRYRSYIGAATFLQRGRVQTRPRWRKVAALMYDLYRRL